MPLFRYYIDSPLKEGLEVVLDDVESHHLLNVTKGKVGQEIELVNGKHQLAKATIIAIERRRPLLRIHNLETIPVPGNQIILAVAMARANRLDTIVEKGTELGMHELWLFSSDLSEKMPQDAHKNRFQRILISAMKQCGRLDLPTISFKKNLKECAIPKNFSAYFGDVEKQAMPFDSNERPHSSLFFVGPESGFSKEEIAWLHEQNVKGVKLHTNILRVDTACIAALTLLSLYTLQPGPDRE